MSTSGAPPGLSFGVPDGVRRVFPRTDGVTRVVLVRHGEAVCNVEGVVGGVRGCKGLTDLGRRQVGALAARLASTGELSATGVLYSSVLPRAI
ncbi:MAG TPA: phosphoglycerate mutase family protein, partial [Acidimicrobiales bacterium]|nr:phosphoglycerate mutase family protein [Acidimicrobiales bacterium]